MTAPNDPIELTREQGMDLFDRRARKLLNISGNEFLRRWDAGDYQDCDEPGVASLVMLIPFARSSPTEGDAR